MDEASRLVSELQSRLKELDRKVWVYRRDMTSEFTKYAEDLLRNVPADVSDKVQKAIAASMKECKSLNPEPYDDAIESCRTGNDAANSSSKTAPLQLRTVATTTSPFGMTEEENDIPRSPHEREKEFTGLFTPSYLPLLDSTTRNERRSSTDKQASPSLDKGQGKKLGSMGVDASTSTTRSLAATPEPATSRPAPPTTPQRRNTDEASVKSDSSDGPIRRSALRRSSSSSKIHSPRRVRFDFAGEEVLPTTSPVSEPTFPPNTSSSIFGNDDVSDEEGGSEQVEDIDDPPPKRRSASQALRALSRGPLEDDGTKWTVVSAAPDSPSVSDTNGTRTSRESSSEDLKVTNGGGLRMITPEETAAPSANGSRDSDDTVNRDNAVSNDDVEDSSEDEMLDMGSRKSKKTAPVSNIASNTDVKAGEGNADNTAVNITEKRSPDLVKHDLRQKENNGGQLKFDEEDSVLFQFDEHISDQRSPPPEEDESEAESDATETEPPPVNLSTYSQSPARAIPWPKESTTPTSPPRSSYKGHPFSESVVNEDLHAQVASLGAVYSFVGSVNGRSGLDESDLQSYRESLKYGSGGGSFSGTPRSMSERMMMDDLMEAEEAKAEKR